MTADTVIEEARRPERTVLGHGYQLIVEQLRRAPREFAFGFSFTAVHSVGTIVFSYVVGWATDNVLIPAAQRGDVTAASLITMVLILLTVGAIKGMGLALRRYGAFRAQYVPARFGFARQRRGLHARFDAVGKVEYSQRVGLDVDAERIPGVEGGVNLCPGLSFIHL